MSIRPLAPVVAVLTAFAVVAPGIARAETVTLQLTSVMIKVDATDKRPKGTSEGDRVYQRNRLVNAVPQFGKPRGAKVGVDEGTVHFTSASTERYVGVARLPDGTIRIEGPVRLIVGGGIRVPVVGGTGRYAGATGMLYVEAGDERALNVYRLTLPGNVA